MREKRKRIRKATSIVVGQLVASTNKANNVLLRTCDISIEYDCNSFKVKETKQSVKQRKF